MYRVEARSSHLPQCLRWLALYPRLPFLPKVSCVVQLSSLVKVLGPAAAPVVAFVADKVAFLNVPDPDDVHELVDGECSVLDLDCAITLGLNVALPLPAFTQARYNHDSFDPGKDTTTNLVGVMQVHVIAPDS